MNQQVLSVTQINEYLRRLIETDGLLAGVAVKGEISNYKVYPSGHHYFTIKDEGASLKCVMFRSSASRLKFRPENGMQVIAIGKISVYPRDGLYQLYCNALVLDGAGDLYAAFEELKKKLAAQGLFDPAHKKPLPKFPSTIGIITSSAGAAVHDMIRILRKRYPLTKVLLLPVRVQGVEAPGEIVSAINYANAYQLADLLIVGRGGGSIEDLWAFNDETVARAIYHSAIPIISAVGHEPDVTISDYVADVRAATPSNGAELAVPDQDNLRQILDSMLSAMHASVSKQLKSARQHLSVLSSRPVLQNPNQHIYQRKQALAYTFAKLQSAQNRTVSLHRQRFTALTAKLDAMSPLKVLTRGYAIIQDDKNNVIRMKEQVASGDHIHIRLQDGTLSATID